MRRSVRTGARLVAITGCLAVATTLMLASPGQAQAGPTREAQFQARTRALLRLETTYLGRAHAREHYQMREQSHRDSLSGIHARHAAMARRAALAAYRAAAAAQTADQVGQWSAPIATPTIAVGVHANLLRTGKVLLFGGYVEEGIPDSAAFLFDPVANTGHDIDPPNEVSIFCGAQTFLSDGKLLVVGGRGGTTHPAPGIVNTFLFDPIAEAWEAGPDTPLGRWYPTLTQLADNRVVITGGHETTGADNPTIETYTEGNGTTPAAIQVVDPNHKVSTYAKQFLVSDGTISITTKDKTQRLDPNGWVWGKLPNMSVARFNNPSGVLVPSPPNAPSKVFIAGGTDAHLGTAYSTTEQLDFANTNAGWVAKASMPDNRAHMNLVLTPDGKMIGIGGNGQGRFGDPRKSAIQYDPATNTWSVLAAQFYRRGYHSTAVLLPDGRIMSAGDTGSGGGGTNVEFFSPPYLFKGTRPQITAAPGQVDYGSTFTITTPSTVAKAVLMAPSATTHADDMHQRSVALPITPTTGGVTATAPTNPNLAPPGYYMLFLLDANDVPSVAAWVHVG